MMASTEEVMAYHNLQSCSNRTFVLILAAFVAAPAALAQTNAGAPTPGDLTYDQAWTQAATNEQQFAKGYATVGFSPAILTIPDRPFTAHRIYTEWARSSDSSTPVVTTTVTIARDNQGRVHYESSRVPGEVTVIIADPVEHLNYRYEVLQGPVSTQTAELCTQPQMSQISRPATAQDVAAAAIQAQSAATAAPVANSVPQPSKQELGTQDLEGTHTYGQQRTDFLTLPTNVMSMVTVNWFSADLGLSVRQSSDNSGQNKFSIDTHDVKLDIPDPNLFVLPAGFSLPGPTASCVTLLN